jgi:hypothetical protein
MHEASWARLRPQRPGFFARFDRAVLQAPVAPLDAHAGAALNTATWSWLIDWCQASLGSGRAPLLQPWAAPAVGEAFSVALLAIDRPGSNAQACAALLQSFCQHLDGSARLHRMPTRAHGWAWRVLIKLRECLWWAGHSRRLPWDAGYLKHDAQALPLWQHFRPRRPTLIVVHNADETQLRRAVHLLRGQSAAYAQPVRLLVAAPAQHISRWVASGWLGEHSLRV